MTHGLANFKFITFIYVFFFLLVNESFGIDLSHLCVLFPFGVRIFSFRLYNIFYVVSFWWTILLVQNVSHLCTLFLVFGFFLPVFIRFVHVLFSCAGFLT